MKFSELLTRTQKTAPADEESRSAAFLIRAGYIHKNMAGIYSFLPLGLRVLENIIRTIREEINAIGGQEVLLASLQSAALWEKTGRWDDKVVDIWFKTELKNGSKLGLATTHEEAIADMMRHYVSSYKDLPFHAYQFQTKFRNELRAKSGLLRTREFIMKDLYSFCRDEEELGEFYEKAARAYETIFRRVGLGEFTFKTFASGGTFSKFSHEFQTVCEAGEDTIYLSKEKGIAVNKEVLNDETLKELGLKREELEEVRAIEVGNIFKLGTRFSEPLGLTFKDEKGNAQPVVMGSYGIGPARVMGTIAEVFADSRGIVWPESVAPFQIHLVGLGLNEAKVKKAAGEVYAKLVKAGITVIYDDREEVSAGEKFADADLLGIPYRAVVSGKTGAKVELKKRTESEAKILTVPGLLKIFK